MENCTFKSKLEFEFFLTNNLTYSSISVMDFDEYKDFVINLFSELNELKKEGLKKKDIDNFVQNHYSNIMSLADDNDILFERKFSNVTEELIEFCADPHFWNTDFDLYIKKWEKAFNTDWFKKI